MMDWSDDDLRDEEFPDEEEADDDTEDSYTTPCPECGADVYEDAEQCPVCGHYLTPDTRPLAGRSLGFVLLAAAGILAVLVALIAGGL